MRAAVLRAPLLLGLLLSLALAKGGGLGGDDGKELGNETYTDGLWDPGKQDWERVYNNDGRIAIALQSRPCNPSLGYLYEKGVQYSVQSLINCSRQRRRPRPGGGGGGGGSGGGGGGEVSIIGEDGEVEGSELSTFNDVSDSYTNGTVYGTTCLVGQECQPITMSDPCGQGVCRQCKNGMMCPRGTSNPYSTVQHNDCPAGDNCPYSDFMQPEACREGYFCVEETYRGGVKCPDATEGVEGLHSWGYRMHCPSGTSDADLCNASQSCPNSTSSAPCPAGFYCPEGANDTVWCRSDWASRESAEDRCPEGSSVPPADMGPVVLGVLTLVGTILILEIGACALVARTHPALRRARHLADSMRRHTDSMRRHTDADGAPGFASLSSASALSATDDAGAPSGHTGGGAGTAAAVATDGAPADGKTRSWRWRHQPHRPAPPPTSSSRATASPPPSPPQPADAHLATPVDAIDEAMAAFPSSTNLFRLALHDVSFTIGRARVLGGLCCRMREGELIALMGESGSGKTTLLNVLGARAGYGEVSGAIELNGAPYVPQSLMPHIGFVPQAYLIHGALTVHENLSFAARLRLEKTVSAKRRTAIIEGTLALLGLTQCRNFVCDHKIGSVRLSGGQLRRVGIGVELVTLPTVLLLDEPTSALDAVNTRLVVAALRALADRGMLLIASLHQPRYSVYQMLDRLLVLRKGEFIYGGPRSSALDYLGCLGYAPDAGENPADFFIEIAFGFVPSSRGLHCVDLAHVWRGNHTELAGNSVLRWPADGECTREQFTAWWAEQGCAAALAKHVWARVEAEADSVPWGRVKAAASTWQLSARARPFWHAQFGLLVTRYVLKILRTRRHLFVQLLICFGFGCICGQLHGPDVDVHTSMTYYALFQAAYAITVAMTTLAAFGGLAEQDTLVHEAKSGVRASADGLARMMVDVVTLVVMGMLFALPLDGFSASAPGASRLIPLFIFIGWAYASLGYFFSLLTPAGAPVATSAAAFVLAIFTTGQFGFHPIDIVDDPGLDEDGYSIFAMLPGFWSHFGLVMIWAEAYPFAWPRTYLLGELQKNGYLPSGAERVYRYETSEARWWKACLLNLFIFGVVVRTVSLSLFALRPVDKKAAVKRAFGGLRRLLGRPATSAEAADAAQEMSMHVQWKVVLGRASSWAAESTSSWASARAALADGRLLAERIDISWRRPAMPAKRESLLGMMAQVVMDSGGGTL
jgi:ABC-type multidrug transport system ATPase subunit